MSVCLSVSLDAFAKFSRCEAQTSHADLGLGGTGRGGVDNFTYPGGSGKKG